MADSSPASFTGSGSCVTANQRRAVKKPNYIHNIPGRLRVRTEAVRNNSAAAAAARALLAATPHVLSVETNPLTGSITVHYDPAGLSAPPLLGILRRHGYLEGSGAAAQTGTVAQPMPLSQTIRELTQCMRRRLCCCKQRCQR
jgi:hypothetical protein